MGGWASTYQRGFTAQIVPPRIAGQTDWLERVIPHEIAHLFFYEITHAPRPTTRDEHILVGATLRGRPPAITRDGHTLVVAQHAAPKGIALSDYAALLCTVPFDGPGDS